MHYYLVSALVFNRGQVRDGYNFIHSSEEKSTIIDFRDEVAGTHAGAPDTYTAIVIPMWQKISKEDYEDYQGKFAEQTLQAISEKSNQD